MLDLCVSVCSVSGVRCGHKQATVSVAVGLLGDCWVCSMVWRSWSLVFTRQFRQYYSIAKPGTHTASCGVGGLEGSCWSAERFACMMHRVLPQLLII
jgi:hypothetical protein